MEFQTVQIVAGSISSFFFITSYLPMLIKAFKTKNLRSYSLSYIILNNVGNLIYWLYVSSLPIGPIWVMHTFYTIATILMLIGYLRYEGSRPTKVLTDYHFVPEVVMLKIGEFSRLSQVTVKTLHHYDEIGLFKPSQTDRFTSYRYYTLDQLPRLHSIMALKELGLSLEEIAQLLRENLSPEEIRGMYRLKHAEAQQRIREEQQCLAQIEFRLRQIELKNAVQPLDIVIKRIEPIHALTLRGHYPTRQDGGVGAVGDAILEAGSRGEIQITSAGINIFYEEEFHGDYFDREIALPVASTHTPLVSLGAEGTLRLRELPAIEAAATYIHEGDYPTLIEKYMSLQRWAVENGYKLSGTWRFVYHRGPMHHAAPSEYLTELQHPIERA